MPPSTIRKRSHSNPKILPPIRPAIVAHEPSSRERGRGNAREIDGQERQHVGERNQHHRRDHRLRIGALRALDFLRDRRGVVPAHVVPHGDQNAAEQARVLLPPARRALRPAPPP